MRITRNTSLLLSATLALAIAAPAAAGPNREKGEHPSDFTNQEHDFFKQCNEEGDYIAIEDGTDVLWPPNHREVPYTVQAVDLNNDDGTTTLMVTATHDEVGMNGAGNPDNEDTAVDGDFENEAVEGNNGVITGTVTLLAERSGQGDGRQYHIDITAEFDEGPCEGDYYVDVPHDMGVKPQDERAGGTTD